jgi:hypothetical protein
LNSASLLHQPGKSAGKRPNLDACVQHVGLVREADEFPFETIRQVAPDGVECRMLT